MTPRRAMRIVVPQLQRLVALVAVLAVLLGSLLAGQRYFYCAAMARIAADDCCASEENVERHDHEVTTIGALPHHCCKVRTFDRGDQGASTAVPSVAPPDLAVPCAIVDAFVPPRTATRTPARDHESRAGPPRAGPLAWRTAIDVSLS